MKISFCTTCMGRAHHLQETLPANISANADYPDVEFVVLDYNSSDGLAEWITSYVSEHGLRDKVFFYREKTAKFFDPRHAKNVAHLLATGDVLINLDADNFTGPGYASKVAAVFRDNPKCFTRSPWEGQPASYSGVAGRLSIRAKDFLSLRGYDESFRGWGAEDPDLMLRADRAGLKRLTVENIAAGERAIEHSNQERVLRFDMGNKILTETNGDNWRMSGARPADAVVNPSGFGKAVVFNGFTGVRIDVGVGVPPGKIWRPVVEINLAQHCNLKCAGCNHASPHFPAEFMSFDAFKADIEALASVMAVGELRFLGGEPLLHPELLRFLSFASASSFCKSISIITNGVLLSKAPAEVWRLVDDIVISRYPGVEFRMTEAELSALGQEHGTKWSFRDKPEFQLILLNSENKDAALTKAIFDRCLIAHAWQCHTVHNGWYYKCPIPTYAEEYSSKVGGAVQSKFVDGIKIHGNPSLKTQLEGYLADSTPLAACRSCLGTSGKALVAKQLNKEGAAAELPENHSDVRSLLVKGFGP